MYVAFHFPSLAAGGVEKNCIVLATEMLAQGHKVDFVMNRRTGEYLEQLPPGVGVVDLGARRTLLSFWGLRRYMVTNRPDVVIANLAAQNIVAVLAKLTSRTSSKVMAVQHNVLSLQSRRNGWQHKVMPILYRLLLPFADRVVAVSAGVAGDMAVTAGLKRSKIAVIHNPAFPAALAEGALPQEAERFLAEGGRFVLAVGRLVDQKGFDCLIEACAIANQSAALRLIILGVGPLLGDLKALAARRGIGDRVLFAGFHPQPTLFMARADLVVMSSRDEGFGNTLVEAMACGTPVVSTDCNYGPSEILENGRYGDLVPVDDANALAQAILKSFVRHPSPAELKLRARDFAVSIVAKKYIDLVEKQDHAVL